MKNTVRGRQTNVFHPLPFPVSLLLHQVSGSVGAPASQPVDIFNRLSPDHTERRRREEVGGGGGEEEILPQELHNTESFSNRAGLRWRT